MAAILFLVIVGGLVGFLLIIDKFSMLKKYLKGLEDRIYQMEWQIYYLATGKNETASSVDIEENEKHQNQGTILNEEQEGTPKETTPKYPPNEQPSTHHGQVAFAKTETAELSVVVQPENQQQETIPENIQEESVEHGYSEETSASHSVEQPNEISTPPDEVLTGSVPKRESKLAKFERQFVDNWTGILGSIIIVMGASFIGIYSVMKVTPFVRFLIVVFFSVALFGIYWKLRNNKKWNKLGLWLRSTAAAIFLFACLGAGGIPGLQFINNPTIALSLLLLGISLNVVMAYAGGKQIFATLHVVLSMVALFIAPFSVLTLAISTTVVCAGIFITYREKWDYHLPIILTTSFLYHLLWITSMEGKPDFGFLSNIEKVCAAIIFVLAALNHYRDDYRTDKIEIAPLFTHLANWLYLAFSMVLFSSYSPGKTATLLVATLAAFAFAKRGKKLGIQWLYNTDTIVACFMGITTILSINYFNLSTVTITAMIYVYCLGFALALKKQEEAALGNAFFVFTSVAGIVYLLIALGSVTANGSEHLIPYVWIHLAVLGGTLGAVLYARSPTSHWRHLATASNAILLLIYLCLRTFRYPELIFVVLLFAFLYVRQAMKNSDMFYGSLLVYLVVHIISWESIVSANPNQYIIILSRTLPLMLASLLAMRLSYVEKKKQYVSAPFLYLFSILLTATIFRTLLPVSMFAIGIAFIILSIGYLEMAQWFDKRYGSKTVTMGNPDTHLLFFAYAFLILFFLAFWVTYLPSETNFIGIKARQIMELFGLSAIVYWMLFSKMGKGKPYQQLVETVQTLFLELLICAIVLIIVIEVSRLYQPVIWILLAIGLFTFKRLIPTTYSRLRFYSVMFSWLSAFHLAFITSTYISPGHLSLDNKLHTALLAILLQTAYLVMIHNQPFLVNQTFPKGTGFLKGLNSLVTRKINLWVYYPFFAAVFTLIWFSSPENILTFLLVLGCFGIFILSITLKENQFRIFSMSALFFSLIRLMVIDLSQSGTLIKSFVFIGIGILMIGMHSLYNKYRDNY